MSIFDPPWLRLHHRLCDEYEHIAFQDHSQNPDKEIDVKGVVARVIEKHLNLTLPDARKLTDDLYETFLNFPLKSDIEEALRKQKPDLPDQGVEDIFLAVKGTFLDTQYEHLYFMYFVISYFIAIGEYTITRGDYLMRICSKGVPDEKGIRRLWRLYKRFLSFIQNEERTKPTERKKTTGLPSYKIIIMQNAIIQLCNWIKGRSPAKPADFPKLVEMLHRELLSLREQWFFSMLSTFKAEGVDVANLNPTLQDGSETDSVLKGYQVTSIMGFAMKQAYLSIPDSLIFFDLLRDRIASADREQIALYNERFLECGGNIDDLSRTLSDHLVRILWGPKVHHLVSGTIRRTAPSLAVMSQAVTAATFGDTCTERKLKQLLNIP